MSNIIQAFPTGGGDTSSVELTQLEYDALTEEEKNNGTVYYITDAQPTNQICYVGSKFNRSDIYKETEQVIGSWMGKPLYQRTFTFSSPISVSNSWVDTNIDSSFMENIISCLCYHSDGTCYEHIDCDPTRNSHANIGLRGSLGGTVSVLTIQYTKTTDSANSAIYASENDYSTDEQIIGTWIDGKPIYQKTLNNLSIGGSWYQQYRFYLPDQTPLISDVDNIIDVKGYVSDGSCINVDINIVNGKWEYGRFTSDTLTALTIQYTKTTD